MKIKKKANWSVLILTFFSFIIWVVFINLAYSFTKPNDVFDASKMGDMSDFDPNKPIVPLGDKIKIAIVASFSGPAATVGEIYWISALWAAHDINKRGGIEVDGKRKMIQVIKADHMAEPAQTKKICERMVLQEKSSCFVGNKWKPLDENN